DARDRRRRRRAARPGRRRRGRGGDGHDAARSRRARDVSRARAGARGAVHLGGSRPPHPHCLHGRPRGASGRKEPARMIAELPGRPSSRYSAAASMLPAPVRVLIVHWSTIKAFVRREIPGRYVTSVMGLSWAIIQPLTLLLLYTFLFSYILKVRFGAAGSTKSFTVYLFCGMLPWIAFSEGLVRASGVILEQGHLIKKVVFPSDILPAYVVLSALTIEMMGLNVLLVAD